MKDFSDEFLGYLEVKQDLLFQKIPIQKIPYYVKESLSLGKKMGDEFVGKSIDKLIAEQGIFVEMLDEDGAFFKVTFRAQFEYDKKGQGQIKLYKKSIDELARANGLSFDRMQEMLLVHEFFHYLEFGKGQLIPEKLEPVETFQLMRWKRNACIQRTSEIAANSFTKRFLGLEVLANFYDYTYLLKTKQMTDSELEAEYQEFLTIFPLYQEEMRL